MANEVWQGSNVNGSAGTNWNIGSNWNTGNVPQAGDNVEIPAGTPLADLFGATATIASLTIDNGGSADLSGDMTITGNLVDSGGLGVDYQQEVEAGGSTLTVDGTLTVTNAGDPFAIGNRFQTASTTVEVAALSNSGAIDIAGNAGGVGQTPVLAELDVGSVAGMSGMAGVLTGDINLGIGIGGGGGAGDALLHFEGGGLINTIENGTVALTGPFAFIASGADTSSDNALSGPLTISNTATLDLQSGPSLATGPLTDAGSLDVDTGFDVTGGSSLTINGVLDVTGILTIGRSSMVSAGPTVTATAGLEDSGTIDVTGDAPDNLAGVLDVDTAAGFGTTGGLTGAVNLTGLSLLDFTGGGFITTIDTTGNLFIDGPDAFLASGNATTSNSALTNLGEVDGEFTLQDGASLTTSGDLTLGNSATMSVQDDAMLTVDGTLSLNGPLGLFSVNSSTVNAAALTNSAGIIITTDSAVDIAGVLANSGNINIGGNGQTASVTVSAGTLNNTGSLELFGSPSQALTLSAGAFDNTGSIELTGNGAQALLDIGSAAPSTWTGKLSVTSNAMLEFASGSINTIAAGSEILLNGGAAFVADNGATGANSALAGLSANNGGMLLLENGASVTTGPGTNFTNAGGTAGGIDGDRIGIDDIGLGGAGGSTLTIGGTLTNTGNIFVGAPFLTSAATLNAAALVNSGAINIYGNTGNTAQGTVDIAGAAPTIWTGSLNLNFDALLEFGGASGIAFIAQGASIDLNGADARIALAGAPTSNSALADLSENLGSLSLTSGAAIADSINLENAGTVTIGSGSTLSLGDEPVGSDLYEQISGSTFDAGMVDAAWVVISGGTFEVASTGTIGGGFGFVGGSGGVLKMDGTSSATVPVNVISGFAPVDTIDLTNFEAVSKSYANQELTLTNGSGQQIVLSIDGGFVTNDFAIGSDGASGTLIQTIGANVPTDFTGDGMSDLLWQYEDTANPSDAGNGDAAIWTMNGTTITSNQIVAEPGANWDIVGTGDFNGDGKADLVWQYEDTANSADPANGATSIWLMNGVSPTTQQEIAEPGASWHVVGVGDFNGDGDADLVWQYEDASNTSDPLNGETSIWLMNGTTPTSETAIAQPGGNWNIVATGDFNGDGKADLVWQYEDASNASDPLNGETSIWLMNGTTPTSVQAIAQPGANWHVVATGDFVGNGMSDLLWQYEDAANPADPGNGETSIWLMNGTTPTSEQAIAAPGANWHVIGTGDYNGDGKADILWQYEDSANPSDPGNGAVSIWLMNGTTPTAVQTVATPPANWHVI